MQPIHGWCRVHNRQPGLCIFQLSAYVKKTLEFLLFHCCLKPKTKKGMAQCQKCQEWFHQSCQKLHGLSFTKKVSWCCSSCAGAVVPFCYMSVCVTLVVALYVCTFYYMLYFDTVLVCLAVYVWELEVWKIEY